MSKTSCFRELEGVGQRDALDNVTMWDYRVTSHLFWQHLQPTDGCHLLVLGISYAESLADSFSNSHTADVYLAV